jgi:raffinose/stachyose/melibiose transport system substrate-binding protein
MKKLISIFLLSIISFSLFSACRGRTENASGSVYYLNFKPEQDAAWQKLASEYTKETGVSVSVLTASEGNYESTLTSEIGKNDPPTLFQVNGPVGLSNWKDYCYDLSSSALYAALTDKDFALKDGERVLGIAYAIETYGIIYNKTLLNKYFASGFSTVKSVEEINNFATFKRVVEEIQANKEAIGVEGAFTSSGMDSSSDWRFKTHLANLPIYYEYKDESLTFASSIRGKYLENYKQIWDLYINNSTTDKRLIATKTATDAETEFKTGKAVFYQNGTWAYSGIKFDNQSGEGLLDMEIGMLPIYIGAPGEENQGLCTGSENYWCVNKNASSEDIDATLKFLDWVVNSDTGTDALSKDMNFVSPFKNAKSAENPLIDIANDYIKKGKESVAWSFLTIPSDAWKNGVGTALTQYAAGSGSWENVRRAFVDAWATEYSAGATK